MARALNRTEFVETINASKDRVWEVLFTQYGDIHIHNPTMVSSSYMNGATQGGMDVVRHCKFNEKLFLDEKINEVNGTDSFSIVVVSHNLPMVKHMSATYELTAMSDRQTQLKMISFNSFSPSFMKYLMRGQMAKSLRKHLFGLKYFAETGQVVTIADYDDVYQSYTAAAV